MLSARSRARCCDSADWLSPIAAPNSDTDRSPRDSSHRIVSRRRLSTALSRPSAAPACLSSASKFMLAKLEDLHIRVKPRRIGASMRRLLLIAVIALPQAAIAADSLVVHAVEVQDQKAVVATVEPVHQLVARARLRGTAVSLQATERGG